MDTKGDKITLKATPRTLMGKSVRRMRKAGAVPANVFGSGFESQAISVDLKEFSTVFREAGETAVIYLGLDDKEIPTLLTHIQKDPRLDSILHIDFRKVDLKKKIEAQVPFNFIGESEAVLQKNGVLITQMDTITVEALPADIPHEIEVDIAVLKEIGDEIKVSALSASDKYIFIDESEKVIVSVTEHKEEVIEVQTTSEAPEILTEKAEGEEGGDTPAEGGAPASEEPTK